jgi:hypothetical protein
VRDKTENTHQGLHLSRAKVGKLKPFWGGIGDEGYRQYLTHQNNGEDTEENGNPVLNQQVDHDWECLEADGCGNHQTNKQEVPVFQD